MRLLGRLSNTDSSPGLTVLRHASVGIGVGKLRCKVDRCHQKTLVIGSNNSIPSNGCTMVISHMQAGYTCGLFKPDLPSREQSALSDASTSEVKVRCHFDLPQRDLDVLASRQPQAIFSRRFAGRPMLAPYKYDECSLSSFAWSR